MDSAALEMIAERDAIIGQRFVRERVEASIKKALRRQTDRDAPHGTNNCRMRLHPHRPAIGPEQRVRAQGQ